MSNSKYEPILRDKIIRLHLEFGLNCLLRRLNLYPNDYCYLKDRRLSYHKKKEQLKAQIKELYSERDGSAGYRMICDLFNRKGVKCSYGKVYSYMSELDIKAIVHRKKKPYKKGYQHHIFDNLIG